MSALEYVHHERIVLLARRPTRRLRGHAALSAVSWMAGRGPNGTYFGGIPGQKGVVQSVAHHLWQASYY